nr:vasopressin,N-Val-Asp Arg [Bos taurus]
VDCYFQNCPRG